ncbi:MAG: DUF47 domain-containing protein [Candidatus Micrarchaeia archaeon]|jgi:uncharacterized protein Yka (UPF0111/DUF47 family)
MSFLKDFFQGGEEGIFRMCNRIVELAIKANAEAAKLNKDITKIHEIEENSDKIVFEIANLITSGGIAPNLIDDMLALIDKEDGIVDAIYNFAREYARYSLKDTKAEAKVKEAIVKMNAFADKALQLLHKMQSSDSIIEIKKLRSEIELIEEQGDEVKDALFDYAYAQERNFKDFYHTFEIAHLLDDVLDNCEDSADMYLTILSSLIS